MGHWIAFIIYPQDGKAYIFDSLRDTNKAGYKHFEIVIDTSVFSYNVYKKYVKDPDCYDWRYEKKIKNGMKLKLRREFPVSTNTTATLLLLLLFS
jgi:hypothetical protein